MKIEIIPAIDIIDGECVRLTQGEYGSKKSYSKNPLEVALNYESIGIKRLHIVDLDGAKASMPQNLNILEQIASKTSLDIQYGGGVKSEEAVRKVLKHGANRVICGSIAVMQPSIFEEWLNNFGTEHIILGADVRDGKVAINGWCNTTEMEIETLMRKFTSLTQMICTDILKDGMLSSPSFELYHQLQTKFPSIAITASGGVGKVEDILKLQQMGVPAVIVGKAIYENKITMNDLKRIIC